jgi:hypothetical protein
VKNPVLPHSTDLFHNDDDDDYEGERRTVELPSFFYDIDYTDDNEKRCFRNERRKN